MHRHKRSKQHASSNTGGKKSVLKKMKRRKKRACWQASLQYQAGRDPWRVAAVAMDPFHVKEHMGDITNSEGNTHNSDERKVEAFCKHHLGEDPNRPAPSRSDRKPPTSEKRSCESARTPVTTPYQDSVSSPIKS